MAATNAPDQGAGKPRHLFTRPVSDEEQDPDYNPYSGDGEFSAMRRGVGDDVADAGNVEPYGHREMANDFNLDKHIWVCGSCGYQTATLEDPDSTCPNCTAQEFVIQHM